MAINPEQVNKLFGTSLEKEQVQAELYATELEKMIDSAFRSRTILDTAEGGGRAYRVRLNLPTREADWLQGLSTAAHEALTAALRTRYMDAGWRDLELRPDRLEILLRP